MKNQKEVEYWYLTRDGYDNRYITIETDSEEEALIEAKKRVKGKDFKIYKTC